MRKLNWKKVIAGTLSAAMFTEVLRLEKVNDIEL